MLHEEVLSFFSNNLKGLKEAQQLLISVAPLLSKNYYLATLLFF